MIFLLHLLPNRTYGQCAGASSCVSNLANYKCINVGLATDIIAQGNLLAYPSPALTQPQKIIVNSFIRFNTPYLFAPGSEIILLPGAQLFVDAKMRFNDVTIRGCGGSWLNIVVSATGQLSVLNSDISNSCEGIVLQSGARVEVVSTVFTDNYSCIQATGNVLLLKGGITHNTFDGTVHTASSCNPTNPTAIRLTNVPYILIGNKNESGMPNEVFGYDRGIQSNNTNIDVVHTAFRNGHIQTAAIELDGTNGVYTANITGRGKYASSPIFVENFGAAIHADNYNLTVQKARFRTETYNILMEDSDFPVKFDVTESRFEDYVTDAIYLHHVIFNKFNVKGCEFFDENFAEGGRSAGIHLDASGPASIQVELNIALNYFYDNAKPTGLGGPYQTYGVWSNPSHNLRIHDNVFQQNYQTSIQHEYKGVWLYGGQYHEVNNNVFNGAFGPMTLPSSQHWDYRGIDITFTDQAVISCNYPTNFNYGTCFYGTCDHTDFKYNTTSGNLTGLYLYPGTTIGQQPKSENLWPGDLPNDIAEAKFDGDPLPNALLASQFKVNSANTASNYWPNPRVPATGWFVYSGNEPGPQIGCTSPPGPGPGPESPKSERERQAITGEFLPYKGYPASTWEAKLDALATLVAHPELLTSGSADAQFYNANSTGNLGKLQNVLQSWNIIMQFSASLESNWNSNQADIAQKIGTLVDQTNLMEQAQTEAEQLQIAQTIANLQTQLQALQATNQNYSAQYHSEVNNRANTLLAKLGNLATTDVWETNLKTVLTLLAQQLLAGGATWTAAQQSTLHGIADQCRHEGGIGVEMARVAIESLDYDEETKCPGKGDGKDRSSLATHLPARLAPNPANDRCLVFFEQPTSGTLLVRDGQGQVVQTIQIKDESLLE